MFDYHIHSFYSKDGIDTPRDIFARAYSLGLNEICFTDHIDFDENITISPPPDMVSYYNSIKSNFGKK